MRTLTLTAVLTAVVAPALAQGPPPARVVTAPIERGVIEPTASFNGDVLFKEIANLATETSGKVVEVTFEEGQHVKAGTPMVRLDDDLLRHELAAARAAFQQAQTVLEQERVRLRRAETLLADEVTTEQEFDDIRFTVESYRHQMEQARAQAARIEEELQRKIIAAPFDGVVVERQTELGEWKNSGSPIAVFARDGLHDIMVNVPQDRLRFISEGQTVRAEVAGREVTGTVVTVVPRGDMATRTFPVKVRVEGEPWLLQGMSASVRLPIGEQAECLLVSRDGILLQGVEPQVAVVRDGRAELVTVEVLGYRNGKAGVRAENLSADDVLVVKGHERLRPGQEVMTGEDGSQQDGPGEPGQPRG